MPQPYRLWKTLAPSILRYLQAYIKSKEMGPEELHGIDYGI
jgi:hypothetical protein